MLKILHFLLKTKFYSAENSSSYVFVFMIWKFQFIKPSMVTENIEQLVERIGYTCIEENWYVPNQSSYLLIYILR